MAVLLLVLVFSWWCCGYQVLEAGGYSKIFIPAVGKTIRIIFKGSDPIESEEEILNKVKSMIKQEKD